MVALGIYHNCLSTGGLSPQDELYYEPQTATMKSRVQQQEIERLKKQLEEKEEKKQKDLQNIISYYYQRR